MIHNLPSPKTTKKAKKLGRGMGSGVGGHTVGRGTKGQRSRSGYTKAGAFFEGGQSPITRRLPKLKGQAKGVTRSFFNVKKNILLVKTSVINKNFNDGDIIDFESLIEKQIIKPKAGKQNFVKVLFDTELDKKVELNGVGYSQKVKDSVESKGGKVN